MDVAELLEVVERLAPAALAEEWDNVGLLVGRRAAPVRRLLVALDLRDGVLDEAEGLGCDAVLTHHPPIFPSLRSVTDTHAAGSLVLRAAERGIAVLSAHTNLDSAPGGLNDRAASLIGLTGAVPLRPSPVDDRAGLGRVGRTPDGTTLVDLVATVAAAFGDAPCMFAGPADAPIRSVGLCTGSGASLIADAAGAGVDAYVTGDLKYHDADRAPGLALVSVPHATVERMALRAWVDEVLAGELASRGAEAVFSWTDTDPWRFAGA